MSPFFKYHIKDAKGNDRNGTIEASDEMDAARKLQEQGLVVVSIEVTMAGEPKTLKFDAKKIAIRFTVYIVFGILIIGLLSIYYGQKKVFVPTVSNKKKEVNAQEEKPQRIVVKEDNIIEPKMRFAELQPFQSVLGDVVFVTKSIYGGDLEYSCILKGRVRNITDRPYKEVYIIWTLWDEHNNLFTVHLMSSGEVKATTPSMFIDKIDYLDSKSEADFQISLDLYTGMDEREARKVKEAVQNDRQEACIYIQRK